MTRYQQALLDELIAHAQQPAPRRARPRRRIALLAAAAAAAVLAVVTLTTAVGGEPAYAVVKHHDGTVTITFRYGDKLADPAAATRDARAAGLPAQVIRGQRPGACTPPRTAPRPLGPRDEFERIATGAKGSVVDFALSVPEDLGAVGNWTVNASDKGLTFVPSQIPHGTEVFIVEYKNQSGALLIGSTLVRSPAPACWTDPSVG
jgi:hypothetical protein